MRELRIPTRKTNPIHNDVPENTTFLLLDQPSGEANTTGTLISKIDEVAINAKTANWKAIVMFLILQFINKRTIYHLIPLSLSAKRLYQPKIVIKCIIEGFLPWIYWCYMTYYHLWLLPLYSIKAWDQGYFFLLRKQKGPAGSCIYIYR